GGPTLLGTQHGVDGGQRCEPADQQHRPNSERGAAQDIAGVVETEIEPRERDQQDRPSEKQPGELAAAETTPHRRRKEEGGVVAGERTPAGEITWIENDRCREIQCRVEDRPHAKRENHLYYPAQRSSDCRGQQREHNVSSRLPTIVARTGEPCTPQD